MLVIIFVQVFCFLYDISQLVRPHPFIAMQTSQYSRCAQCRVYELEHGWPCREVLKLRTPQGRQILGKVVDLILSDPYIAEVVLRYGKALDPSGIPKWLNDSGIIIEPTRAHSIWCLKKWLWLVLATYMTQNNTRLYSPTRWIRTQLARQAPAKPPVEYWIEYRDFSNETLGKCWWTKALWAPVPYIAEIPTH